MDSYYTSPTLCSFLFFLNYKITGMVKANRKDLPKDLIKMLKLKKDESKFYKNEEF